jgi:hypothetical protein
VSHEHQAEATEGGIPEIAVAPPGQLTVKIRDRKADVFYVFRVELDKLRDGYNSPAGVFFGGSLGIVVTLWVAVATTDLGTNRPYFWALGVAMLLLTITLLVSYVRDLIASHALVAEITKDRQLP